MAESRGFNSLRSSTSLHTHSHTDLISHEPPVFSTPQFLVRDWQNFDSELPSVTSDTDLNAREAVIDSLVTDMGAYIAEVIANRKASDLQSTRTQVVYCNRH